MKGDPDGSSRTSALRSRQMLDQTDAKWYEIRPLQRQCQWLIRLTGRWKSTVCTLRRNRGDKSSPEVEPPSRVCRSRKGCWTWRHSNIYLQELIYWNGKVYLRKQKCAPNNWLLTCATTIPVYHTYNIKGVVLINDHQRRSTTTCFNCPTNINPTKMSPKTDK